MNLPGGLLRSESPARWIHRRMLLVLAVVCALFALIAWRAHQLQVRDGPRLRELAEQQYLKQTELPPRRGTIFDRHSAPLAVSVDVDSIFANPRMIGSRAATVAAKLAPLLGLDQQKLARKLSSRRYFTWVKRRVSPQLAQQVKRLKIRGISLQAESRRFYPNRGLGGTVVGFAGLDAKGLEGVELSLDRWLRGSPVRVAGLHDALGRRVLAEGHKERKFAGHDAVLALDKLIQYETEEALAAAYAEVHPKRGWVAAVVLDPRNGDVLAMASLPSYDPNRFGEAHPARWRNRTIADAFEPGSTMKVFSVAGALDGGFARDDEVLDCERGRWRVGRHWIHDSKPHDRLSVAEMLAKSSNICVSKIAFRMGRMPLYRTLGRFGFGRPTGVGLRGERRGTLRNPRRWSDVGLANVAFGQGMTATVLQLARALTAVGNDGLLMRPRLVLRIQDSSGNVVRRFPPHGRRVLRPSLAGRMRFLLRGVTEKGGTGEQAALERFSVAGKTGTAQKVDPVSGGYADDRWLASFIGLTPATDPRLAIAVVVNEPVGEKHYGGDVAAPVFKRIAGRALRYLGVEPDLAAPPAKPTAVATAGAVSRQPKPDLAPPLPDDVGPGGQVLVPDFTGMTMAEALVAAHKAGLKVELHGSGLAVAQSPGPGSAPAGTVCRLSFRPSS